MPSHQERVRKLYPEGAPMMKADGVNHPHRIRYDIVKDLHWCPSCGQGWSSYEEAARDSIINGCPKP